MHSFSYGSTIRIIMVRIIMNHHNALNCAIVDFELNETEEATNVVGR